MLDKIAQIDVLLATYDDPAGRRITRQTDNGSRPSALQRITGMLEEGGHKCGELVKRFQESNPGQKLAGLEAAAKTQMKRGIKKLK